MLSGPRALTPPAFSLVSSWQGIKTVTPGCFYKAQGDAFNSYACMLFWKCVCGWGGLGLWIVNYVDKVNYPCSRHGTFWFWWWRVFALSEQIYVSDCVSHTHTHTPSGEMQTLHSLKWKIHVIDGKTWLDIFNLFPVIILSPPVCSFLFFCLNAVLPPTDASHLHTTNKNWEWHAFILQSWLEVMLCRHLLKSCVRLKLHQLVLVQKKGKKQSGAVSMS